MNLRRPRLSPGQCRILQAGLLIVAGATLLIVGLVYESIIVPRVEQDLTDAVYLRSDDPQLGTWAAREHYGGLMAAETRLEHRMFNITNLAEVLAGSAVPAVQETGPYVYARRGAKYDVEFGAHEGLRTVSYAVFTELEFVLDESASDAREDRITTVNVPYLVVLAKLAALNRTEAFLEAQFASQQLADIRAFLKGPFLAQAKHEALRRALSDEYAAARRRAAPATLAQVYEDVRTAHVPAAIVSAAALRREELVPTALASVFTRLKSTRIPQTVTDYYAEVRADSTAGVLDAMYDAALSELRPLTAARLYERQSAALVPAFLQEVYHDGTNLMLPAVLDDTFWTVADWSVPALLEVIFVGLYTKLGADLTEGQAEAQTRWRLASVPTDLDDLVDDPTGEPRYGFELDLNHDLDPEPSPEVTAYLFAQRNDFSFLSIGDEDRLRYRAWHLLRQRTDPDILGEIMAGINEDIIDEADFVTEAQVWAIGDWLGDWAVNPITVRDRQRQWRQTYDDVVDMDVDASGTQSGFELPEADSGLTPSAADYLWDAAQPLAFTNATGFLVWRELVDGNATAVETLAAAHDELTEAHVEAVGDWLRAFSLTTTHQDAVLEQWASGSCRATDVVLTEAWSELVYQALNDSCVPSAPNATVTTTPTDDATGRFNVTTVTTVTACAPVQLPVSEIQLINATGSAAALQSGNLSVSHAPSGAVVVFDVVASASQAAEAFALAGVDVVDVTKTTAVPCPPTAVGTCPSWAVTFAAETEQLVVEEALLHTAADVVVETRREFALSSRVNQTRVVSTVRDTWATYECGTLDLRPFEDGDQTGFEVNPEGVDAAASPSVELARYLWNASSALSFLSDDGYGRWKEAVSGTRTETAPEVQADLASRLGASDEQVAAVSSWLLGWRYHDLLRDDVRESWRAGTCRADDVTVAAPWWHANITSAAACQDGATNTTTTVEVSGDSPVVTVTSVRSETYACTSREENVTREDVALEVQLVSLNGTRPFVLLVDSQRSDAVYANATAQDVAAALADIAAVVVTTTTGSGNAWTVTFPAAFLPGVVAANSSAVTVTTLQEGRYANVTELQTLFDVNVTVVETRNVSFSCDAQGLDGWELDLADEGHSADDWRTRPSPEAAEQLWDADSAVSFLNYTALPQWDAAAAGDEAAISWLLNRSALQERGVVETVAAWVDGVRDARWHAAMLQETWAQGLEGEWFTAEGVPQWGLVDVQPYEPGEQTGLELASGCDCWSETPAAVAEYVWNASLPYSFRHLAGYNAWVDADEALLEALEDELGLSVAGEAWVQDIGDWLEAWGDNVLVVDDVTQHWATAACKDATDPVTVSDVTASAYAATAEPCVEGGVVSAVSSSEASGNVTLTTVTAASCGAGTHNATLRTVVQTWTEFACAAIDLEPDEEGEQTGFELDPQRADEALSGSLERETLRALWNGTSPYSFLTLDGYLLWEANDVDALVAGTPGLTEAQAALIQAWVVAWATGDLLTAEVIDTWRLPLSSSDPDPVDLDVGSAGLQDGFELQYPGDDGDVSAANGEYLWDADNEYSFLSETGYEAWLRVLSGRRPSTETLVDDGEGTTEMQWQSGNGTLRALISNATNTEDPCRDPTTAQWSRLNLTLSSSGLGFELWGSPSTNLTVVDANVTAAELATLVVEWLGGDNETAQVFATKEGAQQGWWFLSLGSTVNFNNHTSDLRVAGGGDLQFTIETEVDVVTEYPCLYNGLTTSQVIRIAEWLAEWANNGLLQQWFEEEWEDGLMGVGGEADVWAQLPEGFPAEAPVNGLQLGADLGLETHVLARLWDPSHNASFLHPGGFQLWYANDSTALARRTNSHPPCFANSSRVVSAAVFTSQAPRNESFVRTLYEVTEERFAWRGNEVTNRTTVISVVELAHAGANYTLRERNVTSELWSPCPDRNGLSPAETSRIREWLMDWVDHPLTLAIVQARWRAAEDVVVLPGHSQPFRAYAGCEWCGDAVGFELSHVYFDDDVNDRALHGNPWWPATVSVEAAAYLWDSWLLLNDTDARAAVNLTAEAGLSGNETAALNAYVTSWGANPLVHNAVQTAWRLSENCTDLRADEDGCQGGLDLGSSDNSTLATDPGALATSVFWDESNPLSFLHADGYVMWHALVQDCESSVEASGACLSTSSSTSTDSSSSVASYIARETGTGQTQVLFIAESWLRSWLDNDLLAEFLVAEYADLGATALVDLPVLQYGRSAVTRRTAGTDSVALILTETKWNATSRETYEADVEREWVGYPEAFAFCQFADGDTFKSHRTWGECPVSALSLSAARGALDELGNDALPNNRSSTWIDIGTSSVEFLESLPLGSEAECVLALQAQLDLASAADDATATCTLNGEGADGTDQWWPDWRSGNASEINVLRYHANYLATVLVFEPEVQQVLAVEGENQAYQLRGGVYTTRTAHELLYGGYRDPLWERFIAQEKFRLVDEEDAYGHANAGRYALLRNDSWVQHQAVAGSRRVNRGSPTPYHSELYGVGELTLWDGAESNALWGTTTAVSGSDGTQFEPNLLGEDESSRVVTLPSSVSFWWDAAARPLEIQFTGDTTRYGIDLRRFKMSEMPRLDGEGESDEDAQLNFIDVSSLHDGVSVYLGYPHFLNGVVRSIRDGVDGLSADDWEHESVWDVEPMTGQTANVRFRWQTNVETGETAVWHRAHSANVLPVFWTYEGNSISETSAASFKDEFVAPLDAAQKVPVVMFAGGALLLLTGFATLVMSLMRGSGAAGVGPPRPSSANRRAAGHATAVAAAAAEAEEEGSFSTKKKGGGKKGRFSLNLSVKLPKVRTHKVQPQPAPSFGVVPGVSFTA